MKRHLITYYLIFICLFGFSQKHLHNGFVAATSSGVYYLQDGDDQWLKFNGFNPEHYDSRFKRNHIDTITGISFFKDKLKVNGISRKISRQAPNPNYFNANMFLTCYGSCLWEQVNESDQNSTPSETKKNVSNKLKYKYGLVIADFAVNSAIFIFNDFYHNASRENIYGVFENVYFTSFATDNDSVIVCVGKNNVLYKITTSNKAYYAYQLQPDDYDIVSGLTSSASSGHQICYDSNNDLFWIVSDEGKIYNYSTTEGALGLYANSIKNSDYSESICDSITDVVYSDKLSMLVVAARHADGHFEIHFMDNINGQSQTYFGYGESPHLAVNKDGLILVSSSVGEYLCTSSTVRKDVADLPPGVVVYDLDYIDYLPYVTPVGLDEVIIGTQIWKASNSILTDLGEGIYEYGTVSEYGRLYTLAAAQRIASLYSGWHIPTIAEWQTLSDYLASNVGGKLKETGYSHWDNPNTGATNSSGFTAVGAGCFNATEGVGVFQDLNLYGYYLTSTSGTIYLLGYDNGDYFFDSPYNSTDALSLRLIKDTP